MDNHQDNYMVITEKDWENASEKQRSWMLFNTIQHMNDRLMKLEKKPILDKICAFAGGIIGGILSYFSIRLS